VSDQESDGDRFLSPQQVSGLRRQGQLDDEHAQKRRYLAGFETDGTLTTGARAARVAARTVYRWREEDDEFVIAENQARSALADKLEAEAIRRAYQGWERPIYQRGVLVGVERCYSDMLLKMMLGALRPEKYREKVDISGTVDQVIRQVAGFSAAEVV
jgi:hypothetical protein